MDQQQGQQKPPSQEAKAQQELVSEFGQIWGKNLKILSLLGSVFPVLSFLPPSIPIVHPCMFPQLVQPVAEITCTVQIVNTRNSGNDQQGHANVGGGGQQQQNNHNA
jgi:hypothetical protein